MAGNAGYLPASIIGGESISVSADASGRDITFSGFTPVDYSLSYQFAAPVPFAVSATANDEDTGWTLTISGTQTLAFGVGDIVYVGMITDDSGLAVAVDTGTIRAQASPLRVSPWAAVLASVDAAIAEYAQTPSGNIMVDGVSVSFRSLSDLTTLRDYAAYRLNLDSPKRIQRVLRGRYRCVS
jgi:hypothetical protein